VVVICLISMVAVFLPFRVFVSSPRKSKGEDKKTYLFVVISNFALQGEDTKTRNILGEITKAFKIKTFSKVG
jgi:hypothetical protein